MDYIYIDTSVFREQNFFAGRRIVEIFSLAEQDEVKLLIPDITANEIKKHIHLKLIEVIDSQNSVIKKSSNFVSLPSLTVPREQLKSEQLENELEEFISETFKKKNIKLIKSPEDGVNKIFIDYFNSKAPFDSKKKKNEFPDAFSLYAVESWAKEHNKKVVVFSNDSDFKNYESDHLSLGTKFTEYIDQKIRKIKSYKKLLNLFEKRFDSDKKQIISVIDDWIDSELGDISHYYSLVNFKDVHDYNLNGIKTEILQYQTTQVDNELLAVQLSVKSIIDINVHTDDEDYMIRDDDTKDFIFLEQKTESFELEKFFYVDVLYEVDDNEMYEPYVELINKGSKLKI